jgi:hypothetical protein
MRRGKCGAGVRPRARRLATCDCCARYINDTVRVCDGSGEDPTCQDSLKAKQLRHLDHGSYFNMSSECNPMFTPVGRRGDEGE